MNQTGAASTARRMWHLIETVHAVVYFAPEVTAHYKDLGLKGFWMGYFAGRAAPLGPAPPELVAATFFNFHPDMVARALPDAWRIATPTEILDARSKAVDAALNRIVDGDNDVNHVAIADAADLLERGAAGCSLGGRPLFAAHAAITPPATPLLRLWNAATVLREHRGDGHVAAQLAHGFTGLDAHITLCATGAVPRASIQPHRGWNDQDWDQASQPLIDKGLLTDAHELTNAGRVARTTVEERTDHLAGEPWEHLGPANTTRAAHLLEPIAAAVVTSGTLPFPNPMGLPDPHAETP